MTRDDDLRDLKFPSGLYVALARQVFLDPSDDPTKTLLRTTVDVVGHVSEADPAGPLSWCPPETARLTVRVPRLDLTRAWGIPGLLGCPGGEVRIVPTDGREEAQWPWHVVLEDAPLLVLLERRRFGKRRGLDEVWSPADLTDEEAMAAYAAHLCRLRAELEDQKRKELGAVEADRRVARLRLACGMPRPPYSLRYVLETIELADARLRRCYPAAGLLGKRVPF